MIGSLVLVVPDISPRGLVVSVVFLGIAIMLFRLWDDLADLEHDRIVHPQRVLVKTTRLRSFTAVLGFGLLALLLLLLTHPLRLAGFSVLLLLIGSLYHSSAGRSLFRPVRTYIILSKYPILLLIAAAGPIPRSLLVGLGLYTVVGVYEWLHDAEVRQAPLAHFVSGVALGCLFFSIFAVMVAP